MPADPTPLSPAELAELKSRMERVAAEPLYVGRGADSQDLARAAPRLLATIEAQAARIAELEAGLHAILAAIHSGIGVMDVKPDSAMAIAVDGREFTGTPAACLGWLDTIAALLDQAAPKDG